MSERERERVEPDDSERAVGESSAPEGTEVEQLRRQLGEARSVLAELQASKSWRLTRPLRWVTERLRRPFGGSRPSLDPPAPEPGVEASGAAGGIPPPRPTEAPEPQRPAPPADVRPLREDLQNYPMGAPDIRLVAFYLPQYHPTPENDRFWGKGFTEWTNTTRAKPLFEGHHQPRLPGELGFYDLRLKEVQRRQIELAGQAGIAGFCYHYYWFKGRKVLDLPLRQVLEDPSLDFPFCVSWANEAWTAAWDGVSTEGVLIPQDHSPDDDLDFIAEIGVMMEDSRYLRVDGKPILSVYRPGLFPDMAATTDRWREFAARSGLGELYLVGVQNVDDGVFDPRGLGFDAAVEFPPACLECVDVRHQVGLFDDRFPSNVYSYPELVRSALARPAPDYTLLRGIMPGWDNTARRRDGTLYLDSSPELYAEWLDGLCRYTRRHLPPGERLLFVNAWNEWAEGAYLEPDRRYGYAYLNRTASVLAKHHPKPSLRKFVVLGHDAGRAGAQILLLDLVRWLATRTSTELRIVLGRGGELVDRYAEFGEVLVLDDESAGANLLEFVGEDVDLIYANTAVAGKYLPLLESIGAPIVTHIHELEESLKVFAGVEATQRVVLGSERLIAASPAVTANLVDNHGVGPDEVETVYAFVRPPGEEATPAEVEDARRRLGLDPAEVAVFGCGTRDWRKGPDLFVDVAQLLRERGVEAFRFFWIGAELRGHYPKLEREVVDRGLGDHVRFLGPMDDPPGLFRAGGIFLLPSREDPFPLVCLEAAGAGMPTVCFADVGGMPDFIEDDAGFVVPKEDLEAMADAVERLIRDPEERRTRGRAARRKLLGRHTTDIAAPEIFHVVRSVSQTPPLVSVVVPNYNYADRLGSRLDSIFDQTFQDFEVLVLDDASTDDSLEVLRGYASRRHLQVLEAERNQGVFAMWQKGIEAAEGDLVWIAEADDLCEPDFLESLVDFFDDPAVRVAYSQSVVIDDEDRELGDYTLAFRDLSSRKWLSRYQQPLEQELADGLAIQNYLVNASSVLFRKPNRQMLGGVARNFRFAGDWYLYLRLARGGEIAYTPERLNRHRRHEESVTATVDVERTVEEIGKVHGYLLAEHALSDEMAVRMARYAMGMWRRGRDQDDLERFWLHYGSPLPTRLRAEVEGLDQEPAADLTT